MARKSSAPQAVPPFRLPLGIGGILQNAPAVIPVDALAARLGVMPHVLAGLKVAQNWNSETRVTEAEFRACLDAWLGEKPADKRGN